MSPVFMLSLRSIANRRLSVALTVLAVALAVALLLGVERLRTDARAGFAQTISGTDLVVGARGGAVQLLLYSVFHIGDATANLSWASVEHVAALPQVKWLVPLALGDSHRGHRVVGTTTDFFLHYRHGEGSSLAFAAGGGAAAWIYKDRLTTMVASLTGPSKPAKPAKATTPKEPAAAATPIAQDRFSGATWRAMTP